MRNLKMMVTGLALAGLAGCGTALAAERSPSWVAPSASSVSSGHSRPDSAASGKSDSSDASTTNASSTEASSAGSGSSTGSDPAAGSGLAAGSDAAAGSDSPTAQELSPSADASADPEASSGADPATQPSGAPQSVPSHSSAVNEPHGDGPAKSLMKTGGKGVALTFDDGPDPVQTPKLLDLLKKEGVKATFCLVGQNAAAHPALVRRIATEGHTLCNHTWNHSLTLGKKSPAAIRADLKKTNDAIRAAVPDAEIKYMRAPGGNFTANFVKAAADLGMTSIYWQIDPRDWDHSTDASNSAHEARLIKAVKQQVGNGAIILSHDYGQPDTIVAYRTLIPWLKNRYELVALS